MQVPKMARGSRYRVTVPALNGGVNRHDAPHLIEDNQLVDVRSMWWKDQALRTRPGLYTEAARVTDIGPASEYGPDDPDDAGGGSLTRRTTDYFGGDLYLDGEATTTFVDFTRFREAGGAPEEVQFELFRCGDTGQVTRIGWQQDLYFTDSFRNFVRYKDDWYAYGEGMYEGEVYRCAARKSLFQRAEAYAPLVGMNGRGVEAVYFPTEDNNTTLQSSFSFEGVLFEGFNSLTGKFRTSFTTDGKATVFPLPVSPLTAYTGQTIEIAYTQYDGTVTTFHIPPGQNASTEQDQTVNEGSDIPVIATVDRQRGLIYFMLNNTKGGLAAPDESCSNNLLVTAYTERPDGFRVERMGFYTWFGGSSAGIHGGTRLFLSGDPDDPTLICWSDADNPLYFPENNYVRVGETGQAITAFGKQEDRLVIFKEHELYYATYQTGAAYTAEDAAAGSVVDVAANMANFPITQLNAAVGCDCPQTVQLCSNRLVWTASDGKVYTLTGSTPYSESNVRELSAPIEAALREEGREALQGASAGDYDGHYVLQAGNRLYLFDYTGSGFMSAAEGRALPWYIWDIALPGVEWKRFFSLSQAGVLLGEMETDETRYRVVYTLSGGEDVAVTPGSAAQTAARPIAAMCETKRFDFGRPERRKTIRRLHLGTEGGETGWLRLHYATENGVQEDAQCLRLDGAADLCEWAVTPGVGRVRQFGVRLESEGGMALDGMTLQYEMNGEVR